MKKVSRSRPHPLLLPAQLTFDLSGSVDVSVFPLAGLASGISPHRTLYKINIERHNEMTLFTVSSVNICPVFSA